MAWVPVWSDKLKKFVRADHFGDSSYAETVAIVNPQGATLATVATIAGQPISVNVNNSPTVLVGGQPISVSLSGQPISANGAARAAASLLASAARTVTTGTGGVSSAGAVGIRAWLNVTAAPGAQTLKLELWGAAGIAGTTVKIDAPAATVAATGLYAWEWGPGASGAVTGNTIARTAMLIPNTPAFVVVHSGAGSWTYSLECELLNG